MMWLSVEKKFELTVWSEAGLEKLTLPQLAKNLHAIYGTECSLPSSLQLTICPST
jgi:hypothetical protein